MKQKEGNEVTENKYVGFIFVTLTYFCALTIKKLDVVFPNMDQTACRKCFFLSQFLAEMNTGALLPLTHRLTLITHTTR